MRDIPRGTGGMSDPSGPDYPRAQIVVEIVLSVIGVSGGGAPGGHGDATLEGMAMKILKGFRYLILAVVLAFTAFLGAAPAVAATPTPTPTSTSTSTPAPPPKPAVVTPTPGAAAEKPRYDHHRGRFWICRPGYWEPGYWEPGFRWHGHDFPKVWHDRTWHRGHCYWGVWPAK
ncbi:conserved hypothetical protein [Frankia canadensis]|uniref:Uncharacterized protein n=2 Tax=Frankia canadensis TaxID=1836972 RepID=A0A2I2KZU1_9ACTN|nr:conserved hypothetical protein [Frankia canadensis]SOU58468.1 conserved hypothetical protein [Frankia canadensis]